jgi:hypothetical protein
MAELLMGVAQSAGVLISSILQFWHCRIMTASDSDSRSETVWLPKRQHLLQTVPGLQSLALLNPWQEALGLTGRPAACHGVLGA